MRVGQNRVRAAGRRTGPRSVVEPLEGRSYLSMTIDVRAADGSKAATVTSVGQTVNLLAYAVISGSTAGSNDAFLDAVGSFLSAKTASGGPAGDLDATLISTFESNGSNNGLQVDLNGDGSVDDGSNSTTSLDNYFAARSGNVDYDGRVSGDTNSFLIATLTYTVTSLGTGAATDVNFRVAPSVEESYAGVWLQDGTAYREGTADANLLVGSPVVITGPATTATGSVAGTVTGGPAGETVYLDANNNSTPDSGELTTTTGSNGAYGFTNVPAGAYVVRQVVPSGYSQTSPGSNYGIHVTVAAGSNLTGENFTDKSTGGTVSGTVTGGAVGQTIYLDANNDSSLDNGEASTVTASGGTYKFNNVPAGAYVVRQVLPSGTTQTTPGSGYGIHVTVNAGSSLTNENFTDQSSTLAQRTGTTIGTSGSYANSGNTISKATDGNLGTFFDAAGGNGDYVGLDLGSAESVSVIKFAPRSGYASRMVGGVFQASSTADFSSGVTNLYTVGSTPASGSLTTVTLASAVTDRYFRYLAPNGSYGDVAEVQFFG